MTKIPLFKKQKEFFLCNNREVLLEAGIGYGKSRVGSLWLANQTQKYQGSKWILAARDYRQLKTAVDEEFEHFLNNVLGVERNKHYRKTSGSPIEYDFINGSKIYGFGAHNYDTSFRSGSYSGGWCDEVDYWHPDATKALRGRIRTFPEQIRWTSSPKGYNHVYNDFYINKIGPVFNATTLENPTLSKEYIESLRTTYPPRLFEQEVMAKRINVQSGIIYTEFNREINVKECELDPNYPIWVGMDFNVNPMTAVIGQVINYVLYIVDEIFDDSGRSGTDKIAKLLIGKYGLNLTVVPDSTGTKSTTNSSFSDHAILRNNGLTVKAGMNPFRVDRYAAVNVQFFNEKVVISPKCKYTIKDCETLSYKEGTDKPDDSDKTLGHVTDALGYLVYFVINPFFTRKPTRIST